MNLLLCISPAAVGIPDPMTVVVFNMQSLRFVQRFPTVERGFSVSALSEQTYFPRFGHRYGKRNVSGQRLACRL